MSATLQRAAQRGELLPGELRYQSKLGVVLRILEVRAEAVTVEVVPTGRRVLVKAVRDLVDSAVVAENGFRARWCAGGLRFDPGSEEDLVDGILLDELANGNDRLRLRTLDDYLGPVPEADGAKLRVAEYLSRSGAWYQDGTGSSRGFAKRGVDLDWQARWTQSGLSVPDETTDRGEQAALVALENSIHERLGAPRLGKIVDCRWLDLRLRRSAASALWAVWKRRTGASFGLSDEGFLNMVELLPDTTDRTDWERLVTSADVTLNVRTVATNRWLESSRATSLAPMIDQALGRGSPRVLMDLLHLAGSDEDRAAALAALLQLDWAGPDHRNSQELKRLRDWGRAASSSLYAIALRALQRALSVKLNRASVENCLAALSNDVLPSLADVGRAYATLGAVEGDAALWGRFAAEKVAVRNGLTRWMMAESTPSDALGADTVAMVTSTGGIERLGRDLAGRVEVLDVECIASWVLRLAEAVAELNQRTTVLSRQVDDPGNAERVLARAVAEQTKKTREELRASVLHQTASEREDERRAFAGLASETITAIERMAEASGRLELLPLAERVRELVQGLGWRVAGRVGELVDVDPETQQTTTEAGGKGEVRRVGIVDELGRILIRMAVM